MQTGFIVQYNQEQEIYAAAVPLRGVPRGIQKIGRVLQADTILPDAAALQSQNTSYVFGSFNCSFHPAASLAAQQPATNTYCQPMTQKLHQIQLVPKAVTKHTGCPLTESTPNFR